MKDKSLARFAAKYTVGENGCWNWTAYRNTSGYGVFKHSNITALAHRVSYEYFKGTIPDGTEIDHLCKNRLCVNPDHLQAVTHAENVRRGDYVTNNYQRRKTHCKRGHEFTPDNTCIDHGTGGRECRTCEALYRQQKQARLQSDPVLYKAFREQKNRAMQAWRSAKKSGLANQA